MTQTRATAVAARSAPHHASPSRQIRRWSNWPPDICAPRRWSSRSRRWPPTRPARCARSRRMPGLSAAGRSRASATAAGGRPSSAACATGPSRTKLWPALADILRAAGVPVAWVTSVPSASLGDVIVRLAERLAAELGVPHVTLVSRTEDRPPQREMANAAQQAANVRGAFAIIATPPPGTGVLLDDRRHSGWTLAMVGGQLRRAGAQRVVPLALGTLT